MEVFQMGGKSRTCLEGLETCPAFQDHAAVRIFPLMHLQMLQRKWVLCFKKWNYISKIHKNLGGIPSQLPLTCRLKPWANTNVRSQNWHWWIILLHLTSCFTRIVLVANNSEQPLHSCFSRFSHLSRCILKLFVQLVTPLRLNFLPQRGHSTSSWQYLKWLARPWAVEKVWWHISHFLLQQSG